MFNLTYFFLTFNIQHIQKSDTFPEDFNIFLNKEYLFQVEISKMNVESRYKTCPYTVKNMSHDFELIEKFRILLAISKVIHFLC